MDKISYALGMNIAENLKGSGLEGLNLEKFTAGFNSTFEGVECDMTQEEAAKMLQEYFTAQQEKQFAGNIEAGKAFLEENSKRDGVVTLPSGLQYEEMTAGDGAIPTAEDQVECHYHGTLIDGSIFDSSVQRGEAATFPVNGVIPGWVEALQLMSVGSKWKLFVPSDLAYGERGAGQQIGPHTTLIFEVELLGIK